MANPMLTAEDVAEHLVVSQETALRIMREAMHHVLVDGGRLVRVTPDEFAAYVQHQTERPCLASPPLPPLSPPPPGPLSSPPPLRLVHPRTRRTPSATP